MRQRKIRRINYRPTQHRDGLPTRVALALSFLMGSVALTFMSYFMLKYSEEIAAFTRDPENLIAQLGIIAGIGGTCGYIITVFAISECFDR